MPAVETPAPWHTLYRAVLRLAAHLGELNRRRLALTAVLVFLLFVFFMLVFFAVLSLLLALSLARLALLVFGAAALFPRLGAAAAAAAGAGGAALTPAAFQALAIQPPQHEASKIGRDETGLATTGCTSRVAGGGDGPPSPPLLSAAVLIPVSASPRVR